MGIYVGKNVCMIINENDFGFIQLKGQRVMSKYVKSGKLPFDILL